MVCLKEIIEGLVLANQYYLGCKRLLEDKSTKPSGDDEKHKSKDKRKDKQKNDGKKNKDKNKKNWGNKSNREISTSQQSK